MFGEEQLVDEDDTDRLRLCPLSDWLGFKISMSLSEDDDDDDSLSEDPSSLMISRRVVPGPFECCCRSDGGRLRFRTLCVEAPGSRSGDSSKTSISSIDSPAD